MQWVLVLVVTLSVGFLTGCDDDVNGPDAPNTQLITDAELADLRLIDAKATGDTDAVYDLLGRKRDAQTKGLVIKNGIKVLK